MTEWEIYPSLGHQVITVVGLIGTLLGCMENDSDLAIRDEHGQVQIYDYRLVEIWK